MWKPKVFTKIHQKCVCIYIYIYIYIWPGGRAAAAPDPVRGSADRVDERAGHG